MLPYLIFRETTTAGPTLPTTTPEPTTITATAVIKVKKSVLVISTNPYGDYKKQPLTIDLNGNHQKINLALELKNVTTGEIGVKVFWSCSVLHKDTMYVYGGHKHYDGNPYQIAKARISRTFSLSETETNRSLRQSITFTFEFSIEISGCSMINVGKLPFSQFSGSCTVSQDEVYLCFDNLMHPTMTILMSPSKPGDLKTCWKSSDAVSSWTKIGNSVYQHRAINIAASECK